MIVAHGTSYENFTKMMNGSTSYDKNWNVSVDNFIYVYTDEDIDITIERAFSSANLASAIKKSTSDRTVVIELDVDPNDVVSDNSCCDIADFDLNRILCMKFQDFMKYKDQFKIHMFEYYPDDRWKYLYNLYHNCDGLRWSLAENNVVDKDDVIYKCDKWYNENNEYEWFDFNRLGMYEFNPDGWTVTCLMNRDGFGYKEKVIGRFKTKRELHKFLETVYTNANNEYTEEELDSITKINDYNYNPES